MPQSGNTKELQNKRKDGYRTTPHKARLTALHKICGHIFRHSAQKSLEIRQYACELSVQSDEKSDVVSFAQALCGVAIAFRKKGSIAQNLCGIALNNYNISVNNIFVQERT